MSAYMVDRNHIAYMVEAAMSRTINSGSFHWYYNGASHTLNAGDRDHATHVGQILWDENKRSIQARYPDTVDNPDDMPGPCDEDFLYVHDAYMWLQFSPVQVVKSVDCYQYQACEHEGWRDSEAKAFTDALRSCATQRVPGYEAADWGAPQPYGRLHRVL